MKLILQISVTFAIFWEIASRVTPPNFLRCPHNMKAFLVAENSTKQFCDCQDSFLYRPKDDSCYDAFRQGPCPSQHYFVLPPGKTVATCEKNPCRIDGLVPFQGKCHFLWHSGIPCKDKNILGVNKNFRIQCGASNYLGPWTSVITSKSCQKDSYLQPTNDDHTKYKCECKSTYIYSRKNNACYQAYRQGPCSPGNYVVLPQGEREPKCARNPCRQDGYVPFQGRCHQIYKYGPPCADNLTELTVTKNTFQLKCLYIGPTGAGGGGIINAPLKACPPGSRRVVTSCKKVFE